MRKWTERCFKKFQQRLTVADSKTWEKTDETGKEGLNPNQFKEETEAVSELHAPTYDFLCLGMICIELLYLLQELQECLLLSEDCLRIGFEKRARY